MSERDREQGDLGVGRGVPEKQTRNNHRKPSSGCHSCFCAMNFGCASQGVIKKHFMKIRLPLVANLFV